MSLNEIGPRFVLVPVKIFEGSFGGAVVWENKGELPFSQSQTSFARISNLTSSGILIKQPSLHLKPNLLRPSWKKQLLTESAKVQKERSEARKTSSTNKLKSTKSRVAKLLSRGQRFSLRIGQCPCSPYLLYFRSLLLSMYAMFSFFMACAIALHCLP